MSNIIERTLIKENNKLREENEKLKQRQMKDFKYFISYIYWSDTAAGLIDNDEMIIGKKISGIEDIKYMQEMIKRKKKLDRVIVLNFKLIKII